MTHHLTLIAIASFVLTIIVSLTVHEFMHAYVGHLLGDDTASEAGRISLNPLDHIDPMMTIVLPIVTYVAFQAPILAAKPVPFNPARVKFDEFGSALISLAGPVSNFVLAYIGAFAAHFVAGGSIVAQFLEVFIGINVLIFIFNLIPIPPLDGSRVLYAFAPEPVRNFFDQIEPYGFFIIIALVLMGGLGGILGTMNEAVLNILP